MVIHTSLSHCHWHHYILLPHCHCNHYIWLLYYHCSHHTSMTHCHWHHYISLSHCHYTTILHCYCDHYIVIVTIIFLWHIVIGQQQHPWIIILHSNIFIWDYYNITRTTWCTDHVPLDIAWMQCTIVICLQTWQKYICWHLIKLQI